MPLSDGNTYHIHMDRLAKKDDTYYVIDYKTNSKLKTQEEADNDKQLAMYSLWARNEFKTDNVKLVWHMLAFDEEVISERTSEQLKQLESEIISKIKEIESCREFPRSVSKLCDYCIYQSICPSFTNQLEEEGNDLVDEYTDLVQQETKLKARIEELRKKLIDFAVKKDIDVVFGDTSQVSIRPFETVVYPEDKAELIQLLKKKGLYDSLSMPSYPKLTSLILKKEIDEDIIKLTKKKKSYRVKVG